MGRRKAVAGLILNVIGILTGRNIDNFGGPPMPGQWTPVSEAVIKQLAAEGKTPDWPGNTAGVSVDRTTGEVSIVVSGQGIWGSHDRGATFARADGGGIGGRCETGYALNADPAGGRLACFMLDGQSGMTLDHGKTWHAFQQNGRGWDFGAVDWNERMPQHILALHHESGGELYLSSDGGKSWKLLGKDFIALGLFGADALVASKGDGILRSVDGGATWTRVSDRTPSGRVTTVFKGVGYWVTREGLLVSKDRGATWNLQGSPIEAAWGPFFGKDENQIVVVGKQDKVAGLWRTDDAGQTWQRVAPFPDFDRKNPPDWTPAKYWGAGWFYNFGWDPHGGGFYASRMGNPTFQYK
jgi:photosystem II stability/assembly factor-like uncharacterized protein